MTVSQKTREITISVRFYEFEDRQYECKCANLRECLNKALDDMAAESDELLEDIENIDIVDRERMLHDSDQFLLKL